MIMKELIILARKLKVKYNSNSVNSNRWISKPELIDNIADEAVTAEFTEKEFKEKIDTAVLLQQKKRNEQKNKKT